MSRKNRIELIKKIEKARSSRVIAYVTADRPGIEHLIMADVVPIIHEHILSFPKEERKKIDLFLYSRGGQSDVPWSIVSMIREYCEKGGFGVLLPFRAHSASAMISLGADEIVMGPKAELGPIDTTLTMPHSPKDEDTKDRLPINVEDVMGYFSLFEKINKSDDIDKKEGNTKAFELISSQINPLALGSVHRSLQQTKLVAERLLRSRVDKLDDETIRGIVDKMSSEIYSHNHVISRTEAIDSVGIKYCVRAEEKGINELLWELYSDYKEFFSLGDYFDPNTYLIENDLDTYEWKNLPIACVESSSSLNFQTKSVSVTRLKKIPPQVSLALQNLGFPQVVIPNLPNGTTPENVAKYIEQIFPKIVSGVVDKAAKYAAKEFLKALPLAGFQRIDFGLKWNTEK